MVPRRQQFLLSILACCPNTFSLSVSNPLRPRVGSKKGNYHLQGSPSKSRFYVRANNKTENLILLLHPCLFSTDLIKRNRALKTTQRCIFHCNITLVFGPSNLGNSQFVPLLRVVIFHIFYDLAYQIFTLKWMQTKRVSFNGVRQRNTTQEFQILHRESCLQKGAWTLLKDRQLRSKKQWRRKSLIRPSCVSKLPCAVSFYGTATLKWPLCCEIWSNWHPKHPADSIFEQIT